MPATKSGPSRAEVMRQAHAAFVDQAVVWGERDCSHLAAFVARARGWTVTLPELGPYESAEAGLAALKAAGFNDLPDVIEAHGLAIQAAAFAMPADLVAFPGADGGMTALGAYFGNGLSLVAARTGEFRLLRVPFTAGGRTAWSYKT